MKQTEIGLIPDDWEVKSLEKICIPQGIVRGPFGGALKKSIFVKTGYKVYEQRNAIYKNITDGEYYIDETKYNEMNRFAVKANDYIISCSGTIGKIYKIPENFKKGIINQALLKLTINETVIFSDFFRVYFESNYFQTRIIDDTQGGAMKNLVGMEKFRTTCFPVPPLAEQQRIAKALSDVDALIFTTEKLLQKKKNIKQGTMQELLTGKKRLPGFAKSNNTKMTELGEIPEDWEVNRLGDYVSIVRGGSPRPIQDYLTTNSDGINWIKIGDVKPEDKYIVATEEKIISEGKSRSREVHKGDFILSNSMSFGRPYILQIDGCIHDGWLAIQNYQETFDSDFLYYLLGSDEIYKQYIEMAAGSSVQNLNKQKVRNLIIPILDKEEQNSIAKILSDMDNEIDLLNTKLEKYRNLKTAMMQQLLTGKIRLLK